MNEAPLPVLESGRGLTLVLRPPAGSTGVDATLFCDLMKCATDLLKLLERVHTLKPRAEIEWYLSEPTRTDGDGAITVTFDTLANAQKAERRRRAAVREEPPPCA